MIISTRNSDMVEQVGVEITREDNVAIVAFQTAAISNMEEIATISKQIKAYVDKNHPKRLIFDFDKVKFFSSQLLSLLLEVRARLEPYNGRVAISKINPQLHRIFKITNLDRVFNFFSDKESAVKATNID